MTPRRGLYRRLLSYALDYKLFLVISVLGFLLFATMEATLAKTIEYFINYLQGKPSEKLGPLSSEITSSFYFVPIAVVVLAALRGVGSYLGNYFMSRVGLNVAATLRKLVFTHMLYLPQNYYDSRNSGELVSLIIYNIEQVTAAITDSIRTLLRDGFLVIAILSYLLYSNWALTLVFFFVVPLLGSIIYVAGRYFRKKSYGIQDAVGRIAHISTESFQGIKLVKSYLGEPQENARFHKANEENLKLRTKYKRAHAAQTPVLHFIIAVSLAVIFVLVMKVWPEGDSAGAVFYITLAGMIAKPFRGLASLNAVIQKGMAAADTIFSTLDRTLEPDEGKRSLQQAKGEVVFDHVSFSYDGETPTIADLNLSIKPGETVALVGATGSGKSTIASLLLRFYEHKTGSITIDGIPIQDISLQSLRSNIALVNQQTILFNDSVSANIAYGQDLENVAPADIAQAAENAHAKHFIDKLDSQFDTLVGEDGSSLSGGQRQRIAIARGLLKDAPILILDEATSALDNESEKLIQAALERLKEGRTTLVIAHRLSTIENADRIVVLHDGVVVEEGTHAELLEKGGYYANLQQSQK